MAKKTYSERHISHAFMLIRQQLDEHKMLVRDEETRETSLVPPEDGFKGSMLIGGPVSKIMSEWAVVKPEPIPESFISSGLVSESTIAMGFTWPKYRSQKKKVKVPTLAEMAAEATATYSAESTLAADPRSDEDAELAHAARLEQWETNPPLEPWELELQEQLSDPLEHMLPSERAEHDAFLRTGPRESGFPGEHRMPCNVDPAVARALQTDPNYPRGKYGDAIIPAAEQSAERAFDDGLDHIVSGIVGNQKTTSRLAAERAVRIHEMRLHVEARSGTKVERSDAPKSKSKSGWSEAQIVHAQLVLEVASALHITEHAAEMLIYVSSILVEDCPATLLALTVGSISYRHAAIIAEEASSLPKGARGEFDQQMAEYANGTTEGKVKKRARKLREKMHPESIKERRQRANADRYIDVQPGRDGMATFTANVPAEKAFAIFNRCFEVAASGKCANESRTQMQLATDFFTEMMINGDHPMGVGKGIVPTVMVTVPVLSMLGHSDEPAILEGYGPIDPDVAAELAVNAPSFVRLLTHPETGAVLSVGKTRYKVPRDMRMWLRVRDETCRCMGCNGLAVHGEIDHSIEWQHGGHTEVENLAFLCRKHHALKTYTRWEPRHLRDGVIEWTSPLGRKYLTYPETVIGGVPRELSTESPPGEPEVEALPLPFPDFSANPDPGDEELPF
jgi:hypothetical protein